MNRAIVAIPACVLHRIAALTFVAPGVILWPALTIGVSAAAATGSTAAVMLEGVPYIHQHFDTADDFRGGEACCNATAALMALQYYGRLAPRPIVGTRGGVHVSDFGYYISHVYHFGSHTFDQLSSAVWGSELAGFPGGFGYFLQDPTGDGPRRAVRLSEYLGLHGISSAVDTDVAGERGFRKVCDEIDAGFPVVLLAGLAPAGHYITCIGYVPGQHALICHDPAGNKAIGYPNWAGNAITYDWPGWSHGHENLTAVPRLIYARGVDLPPQRPLFMAHPIPQWVGAGGTATFQVDVAGTPTPRLQWQSCDTSDPTWRDAMDDASHVGSRNSMLIVANKGANADRSYRCIASNDSGVAASEPALLHIVPAATEARSRFVNLAARMQCGPGSAAAIVGFVIEGPIAKTVLLRATGPSLTAYGVQPGEELADPVLEVRDAGRANVPIAQNDDWGDADSDGVSAAMLARVGAAPFASFDKTSSALVVTLPPGGYSVIARGKSGTSGIVLVELFEADRSPQ